MSTKRNKKYIPLASKIIPLLAGSSKAAMIPLTKSEKYKGYLMVDLPLLYNGITARLKTAFLNLEL